MTGSFSLYGGWIGYGMALGSLIGAVCALADTLTALWFGYFAPRGLPPAMVAVYLATGSLGGGLAGAVCAATRLTGAAGSPVGSVRIREVCFVAWAALSVLFLLERSMQAEAALGIVGAGLLAAVGGKLEVPLPLVQRPGFGLASLLPGTGGRLLVPPQGPERPGLGGW
jgi:hypothetical protein